MRIAQATPRLSSHSRSAFRFALYGWILRIVFAAVQLAAIYFFPDACRPNARRKSEGNGRGLSYSEQIRDIFG